MESFERLGDERQFREKLNQTSYSPPTKKPFEKQIYLASNDDKTALFNDKIFKSQGTRNVELPQAAQFRIISNNSALQPSLNVSVLDD
jgi:hypothetical protein